MIDVPLLGDLPTHLSRHLGPPTLTVVEEGVGQLIYRRHPGQSAWSDKTEDGPSLPPTFPPLSPSYILQPARISLRPQTYTGSGYRRKNGYLFRVKTGVSRSVLRLAFLEILDLFKFV